MSQKDSGKVVIHLNQESAKMQIQELKELCLKLASPIQIESIENGEYVIMIHTPGSVPLLSDMETPVNYTFHIPTPQRKNPFINKDKPWKRR